MSGRWLLMEVVCLVISSVAHAEPEEMTAEERARLETRARKANKDFIALYGQGKLVEALDQARQALAMRQKLYPAHQFPQGHADLAQSLNNMGGLLQSMGRLDGALEHYKQALTTYQKLYPEKEFPQGHKDLANSLDNMGSLLQSLGRLEEALEHKQQALAMYRKLYPEKQFPQGHTDLAQSLNNMGSVLCFLGRWEGGLEHFQLALAMNRKLYPEKQFPQGHLDLAASLNNVGFVLQSLDRLEGALEHYQQALTMLRKLYPEKQFPRGHSDLASSLNNMGSLLQSLGRLEEAVEHYQQALATYQKLYPVKEFPEGHPDLAMSLNNLATGFKALGRLEAALEHFQQVLATYQKLYPTKQFPQGQLDLASSLNNLGSVLESLGRLEEALEHKQQALAMRQRLYSAKRFPRGHPDLAQSLNNLGSLLESLGQLEKALDHHTQALAMRRKLYPANQFPRGHGDLANSLNNMGSVLQSLGRLEEALEHKQQALAMRRKLYPAQEYPQGHTELALSLNNMGFVLESLEQPEAALDHYQQALATYQKLYPKKQFPQGHVDLAMSLNNMGHVLHSLGRLEAALDHYQQALAMRATLYSAKKYPQGHTDLALSLNNMGSVLHSLGRQEEALEHYQRALATYQQLYPPKQYPQGHTFLALTLRNRGGALLAVQRYEEASVVLEKALVMQRGLADRLAMASSESEALAFNRAVLSSLHFYLSATAHLPQSAPATYARTWIDRAPLNRILLQRHQAALAAASDNPEIRKLFDQLQTTRRDLARLLLQSLPTAPEALQTRDRRVNELTEAKQQQERALVRLLPDLDQQRRLDTRGPEDLRKALPADAVFLDVLRYIRNEYDPRKPGEAGRKAIPHFVAFVVRADAEVQRVELGEAKLIEAMVADYLHLIEQRRDQESPEAAATLRRLVWEPIAAHLPRETHTVYLTPDGDLTRLPWAALPGSKKDTILLEDHALALVPHGPYLLEHLRSERRFGQGKAPPLVLGGVRYSDIPPLLSNALAQRGPGRDGAVENWAYLDGTEREVKLLQKWGGKDTLALEGKDASVPRLLSALPQARLAHLATHGFFNQKEYRLERKRARKQASDLLRSQDLMLDQQQGRRITAGAQTPLAYTGLVLAGANVPDKAGPYGGILTGEAIVDLDLRNLELAMLSACQTGLGEVENGECVHNLQIAFHVAGCANVAATLWNVPDESTAALMGLFYRELLDGGKTPLEALRSAQLYLYRHPGQIKDLAERGPPLVAKGAKLPEPEVKTGIQVPAEGKRAAVKDWAAFVLSGVGR